MKKRMIGCLNVILLLTLFVLAPTAQADETEDIIYMNDGRVLTGQIVEEDETRIVLSFVDPKLNIKGTKTILMSEVRKVERDVATGETTEETEEETRPTQQPTGASSDTPKARTLGALQGDSADESLPSLYVVKMAGQLGTDIHIDVYRDVIEDINRVRPDVVIWKLETRVDENMILAVKQVDLLEDWEAFDLDMYRELVDALKEQLPPETRQVMWVQNSDGLASVIALAWDEMFMAPGATLGGIRSIWQQAAGWEDADVRAKMIAAWLGTANGFLARGGYPIELGKAMMDPQHSLSATWKGREVEWSLDQNGEYIIDQSDKGTTNFLAKSAENFCLSDGTADTLDDLALLMGYREYRLAVGKADDMIDDYVEAWRKMYDRTLLWWEEANTIRVPDLIAALGKQKQLLGKIVNAMNRYKAVEIRWQLVPGLSKLELELMIEAIEQQIRDAKNNGGRGGGGGLGVGGAGDGVG